MSDIRKTCPIENCSSKKDTKIGCWDNTCPKYQAYLYGIKVTEELVEKKCNEVGYDSTLIFSSDPA